MYREFFKFKKDPFHITPDPDFLFLSPSHREASASIFYGIENKKGFVAVTGEVGVGKTTILRSYLEGTDPEKIKIVYIFNATLSFDKLLKQIFSELGIEAAVEDTAELVDILLHYLIDEYRKDRNVVLIIDEAQNMQIETLEQLRMLSNLETSQEKLIQLILVGQPEFEGKLNRPELRQLKQRIAIRSRISALSAEESIAYIHHRLMKASSFHNPVFTKRALKRIIKEAKGVPRTINVLCDNALVTAYGYRRNPVDQRIVKEVIRDFQEEPSRPGFRWKIIWVPAVIACLAAAVFISPSLVSNRVNPGPGNQRIRAGLSGPASATVKVRKPKRVREIEKTSVEKKGASGALVDHSVDKVKKPEAEPPVERAKPAAQPKPEAAKGIATASAGAPAGLSQAGGQPGPSLHTVPAAAGKKAPLEVTPGIAPTPAQPPVQVPVILAKPKSGRSVVVKLGDSVSKLLVTIHGSANSDMLESFKELNPQIKDINRLSVGEKIILP